MSYYSYAEKGRLYNTNKEYVYFGIEEADKILKAVGAKLVKAKRHYQVSYTEIGITIAVVWEDCGVGTYRAFFEIYILNRTISTTKEGFDFSALLGKYFTVLDKLNQIEVYAYETDNN